MAPLKLVDLSATPAISLDAMSRDATSGKTSTAIPSVIYKGNERFGQPNVRLLPDPSKTSHWSTSAWKNRAVIETQNYHILYTQAKEDNPIPNTWLHDLVSGDAFLLRLSDTAGQDGTWSYQDITIPDEGSDSEEKRNCQFLHKLMFLGTWKSDVTEVLQETFIESGKEELERSWRSR